MSGWGSTNGADLALDKSAASMFQWCILLDPSSQDPQGVPAKDGYPWFSLWGPCH